MPTMELFSENGKCRLTISTILNHLIAFHEAGFEYKLEEKIKIPYVWWNPATFFGYEWRKTNKFTPPDIRTFVFIQGADIQRNPFDFNVSRIQETGYYKSSCIYFGIGFDGGPTVANQSNLGNDARSINRIILKFRFNGTNREIVHQ